MNLYSIGLAAASGGIAVIIASLIFGRKPANKIAYSIVIAILFFTFNFASKEFILPDLNLRQALNDIERVTQETPAFGSIKKYEPEVYQKLVDSVLAAVKEGANQQQIADIVRTQISSLIESRLAHASDDALVSYVNVMISEMEILSNQGNGLCYKFLFPQVAGGIDARKAFTKEMQQRDLAALDEIIKSSNTKKTIPEQSTVMPYLQPVIIALSEKHGDDVTLLDNPSAPNVDKEKLCKVSIDLYRGVLALPVEQSAPVLRWMFGQA